MEGKVFLVVRGIRGGEKERKLNFKKLKWKTTFPVMGGRER